MKTFLILLKSKDYKTAKEMTRDLKLILIVIYNRISNWNTTASSSNQQFTNWVLQNTAVSIKKILVQHNILKHIMFK